MFFVSCKLYNLQSILSDATIANPALLYAWNIFLHGFTPNLFWSLNLT